MLKSIWGRLRSHGGLDGTEQCKTSFFLNPTACSSSCNRIPKGGTWLGLRSKDLLNLELKTDLYAGLWVEVRSFTQYCIESFWGFFLYGTSAHIISQTFTWCFIVAGVIRSKLLLGQNIISPSKVDDGRTWGKYILKISSCTLWYSSRQLLNVCCICVYVDSIIPRTKVPWHSVYQFFWPTACCLTRHGHTKDYWKCSHLGSWAQHSILNLCQLQVGPYWFHRYIFCLAWDLCELSNRQN